MELTEQHDILPYTDSQGSEHVAEEGEEEKGFRWPCYGLETSCHLVARLLDDEGPAHARSRQFLPRSSTDSLAACLF